MRSPPGHVVGHNGVPHPHDTEVLSVSFIAVAASAQGSLLPAWAPVFARGRESCGVAARRLVLCAHQEDGGGVRSVRNAGSRL